MIESNKEIYDKFWEIYKDINPQKRQELLYLMKKKAINFNLFKDGNFIERKFPFDMVPRIISNSEFTFLENGLKQRIFALNEFLNDIYSKQRIIKDGIIPADFVFSSSAFLPNFMNVDTNKFIRTHISGIDLVKDTTDDSWVILEDNLRVPSGVSYPLSIRKLYRKIFPEFFEHIPVYETADYPKLLRKTMDYVNCGGINVVLTPGRYNSAFYEHSYLAKESGAILVTSDELFVDDNRVYLKNFDGKKVRVGAIYRRIGDEALDPLEFDESSLIGVPNISNAYRSGNVALMNGIGNGIADDKGIYYFVPQMIKYYMNEEPILKNAPTYLTFFENDRKFVLDNIDKLVIKDVAEAGGYGVVFGSRLTKEQRDEIKQMIINEPRRFIAQEVVEFYDIECMLDSGKAGRKSDLRVFCLYGEDIHIWHSGLTRYAIEEGSYIVNSSQGGGFKDTWILKGE
jgi:uncharacterized circularly permuted ATP-grasp superfamily protein